MRVLVTGASGYLGRVVVGQLLRSGHEAIGLVHWNKPEIEGVLWRQGDMLNVESLRDAASDVDAVIHLCALAGVRNAFAQPTRYFQLNVGGTLNLLEALIEHTTSAPRLVLASTVSVYGAPSRQPITEGTPTDPRNPYAASKLAAEQAIAWQSATGCLGAVTLRISNIAGGIGDHGDRDDGRLITRVCAVANERIPKLDVYGDGAAIRDFVHVVDTARALVAALNECEPGRHRVFNIGATPASVAEVIAAAKKVTGREIPVGFHPAHPGEVREIRADITKAREILRWRPRLSALERLLSDQWKAERARS